MRRTTQRPAGGVQSSAPSERILAVRSIISFFLIASRAATGGVGNGSRLIRFAKPAFSSNRLTRAPGCSTSSAIWYAVGGGGILKSKSVSNSRPKLGGVGGAVVKLTRKKRAV